MIRGKPTATTYECHTLEDLGYVSDLFRLCIESMLIRNFKGLCDLPATWVSSAYTDFATGVSSVESRSA